MRKLALKISIFLILFLIGVFLIYNLDIFKKKTDIFIKVTSEENNIGLNGYLALELQGKEKKYYVFLSKELEDTIYLHVKKSKSINRTSINAIKFLNRDSVEYHILKHWRNPKYRFYLIKYDTLNNLREKIEVVPDPYQLPQDDIILD